MNFESCEKRDAFFRHQWFLLQPNQNCTSVQSRWCTDVAGIHISSQAQNVENPILRTRLIFKGISSTVRWLSTKVHFKSGRQMAWNMKSYLHFINQIIKPAKMRWKKTRKWRLTKLVWPLLRGGSCVCRKKFASIGLEIRPENLGWRHSSRTSLVEFAHSWL